MSLLCPLTCHLLGQTAPWALLYPSCKSLLGTTGLQLPSPRMRKRRQAYPEHLLWARDHRRCMVLLCPFSQRRNPRPKTTELPNDGASIGDQGRWIPNLHSSLHTPCPTGKNGLRVKTSWVLGSLCVFQTGCCSRPRAWCSRRGSPSC